MNIGNTDIRCCILIRGIRSSTTKEIIRIYCEKYGPIKYLRCAISSQGVMRGYNVVFKQEQGVNRFMDDRPHHIDGQSVKVKRCIPPNEEWRLTNEIVITTSDNSADKQIFHEQILRDYFSRYGTIRACHIDTYHNRPCAYLTFSEYEATADYDRVDQLVNDKPHMINKVLINVRKQIIKQNKSVQTPLNPNKKRRQQCSNASEHQRIKQHRSSTIISSKINPEQETNTICEDTELIRLKNANDLLIREVESLISPSTHSIEKTTNNQILNLQNEYGRLTNEMIHFRHEHIGTSFDDHTNTILNKLQNDVENLLKQIQNMQQQKKTFADELFDKYTIEYILSLNENDVQQRLEQLEKENQLLLLIKQNMPKMNHYDN